MLGKDISLKIVFVRLSVQLTFVNINFLNSKTVRKRVEIGSYGGGDARQESYDVFADDRSINRYVFNLYRVVSLGILPKFKFSKSHFRQNSHFEY